MRISDWSSDVCSSDLRDHHQEEEEEGEIDDQHDRRRSEKVADTLEFRNAAREHPGAAAPVGERHVQHFRENLLGQFDVERSEEHTSELQSLMRISYAVFCLKNKNNTLTLHIQLRRPYSIFSTNHLQTQQHKHID